MLAEWLTLLVRYGLARLRDTPDDIGFLAELAARIGPIRSSNFGDVWSVRAKVDPDSTAYTGLNLGQHTDLPTRETPPGFQFLHCVENTCAGGWSRMTDGLAVADELAKNHPDDYEALTTLRWVFFNRSADDDHRWSGPIIDHGGPGQPLTLRAFYPVPRSPTWRPPMSLARTTRCGASQPSPTTHGSRCDIRSVSAISSGSTTGSCCTAATRSIR